MKKNKMMRAASALLVAVLLTTSVISGTFAKYVTTGKAGDSARVAKWGVTINSENDGEGTFKETYASETSGYTENTVISSEDVVAPGTTGTLVDVVVAGTPEVAVRVTYEANLTLTGWTIAEGNQEGATAGLYCPLVFKVEEKEYKIDGNEIKTLADLEAKVEAAIAACTKDYPANQAITMNTDAPSVTWTWAIGNPSAEDTYLGNQAAKGNASTVSLEVTTTATQID